MSTNVAHLAHARVVPLAGDVDRNQYEIGKTYQEAVVPLAGDVDRNASGSNFFAKYWVVPLAGDVDRKWYFPASGQQKHSNRSWARMSSALQQLYIDGAVAAAIIIREKEGLPGTEQQAAILDDDRL